MFNEFKDCFLYGIKYLISSQRINKICDFSFSLAVLLLSSYILLR